MAEIIKDTDADTLGFPGKFDENADVGRQVFDNHATRCFRRSTLTRVIFQAPGGQKSAAVASLRYRAKIRASRLRDAMRRSGQPASATRGERPCRE